jgi:GMP synthase (glutamine-hydrolysing)
LSNPPPFLVLQHAACEPPAAYEDELRARGLTLQRVQLDEGEPLPGDWHGFAGIIAMGGPMGVHEAVEHPWMARELDFIGAAVRAGVPYWGVCLGAQLLAAGLGGRVMPGPRPEVGVLDVRLTPEAHADPVFAAAPTEFATLQWHSDTYELPAGATRLAESDSYAQQAFRFAHAYALQFHLEVPPELVASWAELPAYARSLDALMGPGALPRLVEDVRNAAPTTLPLARRLFGHWLDDVVGVSAGATWAGR